MDYPGRAGSIVCLQRINLFGHRSASLRLRSRCTASMPVLVLAGTPPESRWTDWNAQVQSVIPAPCPMMAVDLPKMSTESSYAVPRGLQGPWTSATSPWMSPVICGSQFIPSTVSLQDRRMVARSTGRNSVVTNHLRDASAWQYPPAVAALHH